MERRVENEVKDLWREWTMGPSTPRGAPVSETRERLLTGTLGPSTVTDSVWFRQVRDYTHRSRVGVSSPGPPSVEGRRPSPPPLLLLRSGPGSGDRRLHPLLLASEGTSKTGNQNPEWVVRNGRQT